MACVESSNEFHLSRTEEKCIGIVVTKTGKLEHARS